MNKTLDIVLKFWVIATLISMLIMSSAMTVDIIRGW